MLIRAVLQVVLRLVTVLMSVLPALPGLPSVITDVWSTVVDMLSTGLSFVGNWLYLPVAMPCLLIVILADNFIDVYRLIGLYVSKIPFINIRW